MNNQTIKIESLIEAFEYIRQYSENNQVELNFPFDRMIEGLIIDYSIALERYNILINTLSKNKNIFDVYIENGFIIIKPMQDKECCDLNNILGKYEIAKNLYEADGVKFTVNDCFYMNTLGCYKIALELI